MKQPSRQSSRPEDDLRMDVQLSQDSSDEYQASETVSEEEEFSDYAPEIQTKSKKRDVQQNVARTRSIAPPSKKRKLEVQQKEPGHSTIKQADLDNLKEAKESLRIAFITKQQELKDLQEQLRQKDVEILQQEIRQEKAETARRQQKAESRIAEMEASLLKLASQDGPTESAHHPLSPNPGIETTNHSTKFGKSIETHTETLLSPSPYSELSSVLTSPDPSLLNDEPEDRNASPDPEPTISGSKLEKPLSELTKSRTHVQLVDVESFVHRTAQERQKEMKEAGQVKRPLNAFMLYRKAYQNRTKDWCLQDNLQVVSRICGQSWQLEPKEIREHFEKLGAVERANHTAAHPDYKFSPRKIGKAPKEIDPWAFGIFSCPTCRLTWLLGTKGSKAGKSHPSHHTQSQEFARSLLVLLDCEFSVGASYSISFAFGSKYNVNEAVMTSPTTRERVEMEAVLRTLQKVREEVLPDRQDLIETASDKAIAGAMKTKLVIMTPSQYVVQAMSTHHDVWAEKDTIDLLSQKKAKAQVSTKGPMMKMRTEATKLSTMGVQVTFFLVSDESKIRYTSWLSKKRH